MLHIATCYMSILPDVALQCRLPFKLVSHNFDSYIQLLYGDKSSSVEEDLSSMVMVRAGLRWLRFKVMKIRFGHVHWSSLNSLSHVPRDGQKVFSSPCAIVADLFCVLFCGCSDLFTIFIVRCKVCQNGEATSSIHASKLSSRSTAETATGMQGEGVAWFLVLRCRAIKTNKETQHDTAFRNCVGMTCLTRSGNFHFPR